MREKEAVGEDLLGIIEGEGKLSLRMFPPSC